MKKTIIALAAASSVALSHGVAVAEDSKVGTEVTAEAGQTAGSSNKGGNEAKGSSDRDLGREIFGWQDGTQQAYKNGVPVFDAKGNPVPEEKTTFGKKFKDIAGAVAAVVALLGSISALVANIEKIAKQFTK
ncbi:MULTISPECIES: hypothetical protein [unclassified Corynebacterium]|uniref:hypothetical protein n=1 Tax=unclassified Corynebacterium TaxID=2624378 RepID=UPI0008A4A730|nr:MULTISPECIES: hypothetical protein [unclassified Corynebacterium]OFO15894.1 hypothetical protein HMPREF3088_02665 [Corynebacterium sp. HMSC22B11]OFS17294.1 hypothetical protein HMPREF3097_06130 [Corynebacterium sp. HMSC27B11]